MKSINFFAKVFWFVVLYCLYTNLSIAGDAPRPRHGDYVGLKFQFVRTFHSTIEIEIRSDYGMNVVFFTTRVYSGRGGFDWGDVLSESTRRISREEFDSIISEVEGLGLPELYGEYPRIESGDGSMWRIAGVRMGSDFRYTFRSPPQVKAADKLVVFGRKMLNLGNIKLKESEFY